MRRALRWLGLGVATLLAAVVALLLLLLYTAAGRDRVRDAVVHTAARHLTGSLHLETLRFSPSCAIALDSLAMRDADDSLLVATGPLVARCDAGALLRGRLVLRTVAIDRPVVVVREGADGTWNWARALRRDTVPRPSVPRTATALVADEVRLTDGTVAVIGPGTARRGWRRLQLVATDVRVAAPDADVALGIAHLAALGDDPPVDISDLRGTLRVARDSLHLAATRLVAGRSTGRFDGAITWAGDAARFDVRADADTIALADLAWIDSLMPREGGGRGRLHLRSGARAGVTEWSFDALDVTTDGSRVRGRLAMAVDSEAVSLGAVALALAPLRLDLVERLLGAPLPYGVRGDVGGRVVAHGVGRGALALDTVELRWRDARVPGATSDLRVRGTVDASDARRPRLRGLHVESDRLDARSLVASFPSLPRLGGRFTLAATLDSAVDDLRLSHGRVEYREGRGPPLALRVDGRVSTRGRAPVLDGTVRLEPLSFAALAGALPAVRGLPELRGDVTVRGALDDLALRATLASVAGTAAWDGRVDLTGPSYAASGRLRVGRLDLHALDRAYPSSDLGLDAALRLRGASVGGLAGAVEVQVGAGHVAELALLPSDARLRFQPGRVVVDSATVRSPLVEARASGALGLARARHDTLDVALRTDSLAALLARLRSLGSGATDGAAPSASAATHAAGADVARHGGATTADTSAPNALAGVGATDAESAVALRGSASATVRLVGALDAFDARGSAELAALTSAPLDVARGRAELALVGLPAEPRGTLSLALDGVRAAGVRLDSLRAEATAERPGEWRVAARSGPGDEPGFAVLGAVSRALTRADSAWSVAVDSLDIRVRGTGLRLLRPARLRVDGAALVLDTVELRGRLGSHLRAAATIRRDGALDAVLSAEEMPLHALVLLGAPLDSATLDRLPSRVGAALRVGGTRAAPVATFEAALRAAPRDSALLDSVRVSLDYADARATASLGTFGADRRLVTLDAAVPVHASLAPVGLTLLDTPLQGRLSIDSLALRDVGRSFPALPLVGGVARARVDLGGTGRHPRFAGGLRVTDGALAPEALGVRLDSIEIDVALLGDTLRVRRGTARGTAGVARGMMGGGGGTRSGTAALDGWIALGEPSNPHVDLRLRAERLPVVAPERRVDVELDAALALAGPLDRATLGGRATVSRGVIRLPELGGRDVVGNEDSAFVRLVDSLTNRGAADRRAAAADSRLDRLAIRDLELRVGTDVWLRSAEANLNLGGGVTLTRLPARGTGAPGDTTRVTMLGELRTVRGTYTLDLGVIKRTFELERGTVRFTGEHVLDPQLDVSAIHVLQRDPSQARTQDVRIRARLRGTVSSPTLTIENAAERSVAGTGALSQEELLSYLVTGQPSFRVGGGETSKELAGSELSARVTSGVASRLSGGSLFDIVTITPGAITDDAGSGVWEQTAESLKRSRVGVGKKLDERTFLTVDAGGCALAGATSETSFAESLGLSLEYRPRMDLTFSLKSEPPTSATLCGGALPHGFAPAPRQWGLEARRRWRF